MIYSVWNPGTSQFDYFETNKLATKLNVEKPAHITQRTLGSTPEQAAWPLPRDARPIGTGPDAIGRVASHKSPRALGDATDNTNLAYAGALLVGGYLLWKYVVNPPRRKRA